MTDEERCYHVETLEQIKFRCEEKGYSGEVEALDVAIELLEQTRWIPCSERQPKKNGNYHVTVESNDGTASIKYQTVDHYGPKWLHDDKMRKVIAWRPLPETYEDRERERQGVIP